MRQSDPASLIAHATSSPLSLTSIADSVVVPCVLSRFGSRSTVPSPSGASAVHSTSWSWRPVLRSWNQRSPRRQGAPARGKSHSVASRSRISARAANAPRMPSVSRFSASIQARDAGASLSSSGRYGSAIRVPW